MPGLLLPPSARPAMKRPSESSLNGGGETGSTDTATMSSAPPPAKRARLHRHTTRHKQPLAREALDSGVQDEEFFQAQLMRAIVLALAAQGFGGVQTLALEEFRMTVETFILNFLKNVKLNMRGSRRDTLIPQDFSLAFAQWGIQPDDLLSFLKVPSAPSITQPSIPPIPEPEPPLQDFDTMLGIDRRVSTEPSEVQRLAYIPTHLPGLPNKHTYKSTAIFATREEDARKLREKATQEGVLAEQALRRLMEASSGTRNKRAQGRGRTGARSRTAWAQALEAARRIDAEEAEQEERRSRATAWAMDEDADIFEEEDNDDAHGGDSQTQTNTQHASQQQKLASTAKETEKIQDVLAGESATMVNYDKPHWRQAARTRA